MNFIPEALIKHENYVTQKAHISPQNLKNQNWKLNGIYLCVVEHLYINTMYKNLYESMLDKDNLSRGMKNLEIVVKKIIIKNFLLIYRTAMGLKTSISTQQKRINEYNFRLMKAKFGISNPKKHSTREEKKNKYNYF